ncbi:MAG: NAD(P)/FAD-dependent oxidoreductase [Candidatus Nanopelagicales bacterium]
MIDLIVAGGGPIGLMTAIHARLAGMDVTVVEPRTGPIDKACGEGLMPDALSRLQAVGVDPPGQDFHGIRYIAGGAQVEARFRSGPGRGVRRLELQSALLRRAEELGVGLTAHRVTTIRQGADWVDAGGLRARYIVGADGLHSRVRRSLGLEESARGQQRFGLRQHYGTKPWTDLVEVYWLSDAEVYVTPVGANTVGVALLGRAPLNLDAAIAQVPGLASRLQAAPRVSEQRAAGPLRQHVSARSVGRAMLVGDAAGYVDALTGEGLRVGFAEAEAVVRAVLADHVDGYEHEWRRITRSYRWTTSGLLWASSQRPLRPLIVPAARALPSVFGRIVDSLAT